LILAAGTNSCGEKAVPESCLGRRNHRRCDRRGPGSGGFSRREKTGARNSAGTHRLVWAPVAAASSQGAVSRYDSPRNNHSGPSASTMPTTPAERISHSFREFR
jgi:hypothetical protein